MDEKIQYAPKPNQGEPWDVVIIGSGPAALTAAIYTTRGAVSTLILGGSKWGGQLMLTTLVDNFPGFPEGIQGPELMMKLRRQAERFGAELIEKDVYELQVETQPHTVSTSSETFQARSIIIATGADTKWLGVPGEDKLRGRGISSCAPCDAPFFKDKKVAVVGGGDAALEEALVLTKYTSKITLIHRRDQLRASHAMQQKIKGNEKINIIWDTEVMEMSGDSVLSSVKLKTKSESNQSKELKSGMLDKLGGKMIQEIDGSFLWEMPLEGLFVAVGHAPATGVFKGKVEMDKKGYIIKDKNKEYLTSTSVEGIFVAGDVNDYRYKQAITASGYGCMAGMDVLKYLDKKSPSR